MAHAKPKTKPGARKRRFLSWTVVKNTLILLFAIGIFMSGIIAIWVSTLEIPTVDSFRERRVAQSTKIYDKTGEVLLYDVYRDFQRTVVPFDEIDADIKEATLAIEDPEFYRHYGIKPSAIVRASFVNLVNLRFEQGGSTITQQVVKNSLLTPEKTITRKIKEWLLALKIERVNTKDEILNIYLNESPYGGSLYGVEEASQAYFNTSSDDISIAQAAYLAALPQAPTFYLNNPAALENRKNQVLVEMRRHGYITAEEYRLARDESYTLSPTDTAHIKAPHFVMYVISQLIEEYGEQTVRQGGLRVTTSLNYELQEPAEEILFERARSNASRFNAENASLVAIDPTTGGIEVMVGSRNYFSESIQGQFNVSTASNRQPGSTFKPFAYAAALSKGYTPETVVFDLKTQFSTACAPSNLSNGGDCYSPQNYDERFRGPVSFREALAQSINIPAIKVLYLAGMDTTIELARAMGVENLGNIRQYGLTLVLGGGEVSLLDMTSAYGVFANEGVRNTPTALLKVEDSNGEILFEHKKRLDRVLAQGIALQISDMLSDNDARAPAFGQNSLLHFAGRDVAVKTGTTNDYKDAWIIGYTPDLAVGTWAGNNDGSSMVKEIAGFIVAPMWREFMDVALADLPVKSFPNPPEENRDDLTPILAGTWNHGGSVHSILHWVDRNNPRGPVPRNPHRDGQYAQWEYPVRLWAEEQGHDDTTATSTNATSSDDSDANDDTGDDE
ncbi:MAG: PBP1A family penicillin-binding protein [Candidatus Paceibacterota bacterium]